MVSPSAQSGEVLFTIEDLDSYIEMRSRGREKSTARILSLVRSMLWKELNGSINRQSLSSLSNAILSRYQSDSSIHKFFMYSRGFINYLYKMRMDSRLHAYYSVFEKPKVRREKKLMTSRIITPEDISKTLEAINNDNTQPRTTKDEFIAHLLFLAYSGQRPITTSRLTVKQFRQALQAKPPVLVVEAWQEKTRLEHYVPLHPAVVPYVEKIIQNRNDNDIVFNHRQLQKWLLKTRVQLSRVNGKMELKDLRKAFEQISDGIGFVDANKNFMMAHCVSGVNWTSYKQFLPESVYQRYFEKWQDVKYQVPDTEPVL